MGSMPSRAQARSRNDSAGTISTSIVATAAVGQQQLDGALGHHRRAGHGVDELAVPRAPRPGHELVDDLAVDVVERRPGS